MDKQAPYQVPRSESQLLHSLGSPHELNATSRTTHMYHACPRNPQVAEVLMLGLYQSICMEFLRCWCTVWGAYNNSFPKCMKVKGWKQQKRRLHRRCMIKGKLVRVMYQAAWVLFPFLLFICLNYHVHYINTTHMLWKVYLTPMVKSRNIIIPI